MKVRFRTKEEANKEQEEEFLALSPIERIYSYLDLMQRINRFSNRSEPGKKGFTIQISTKG